MTHYDCVGVDVAKDKFDVVINLKGKYKSDAFANDKKGWIKFLKWLNKHTVNPWICMEATGHYSELIGEFLVEANIRVSIVNPLQIKSFARAKLSRNKNDIIDSRIILEYCHTMQPRDFQPRPIEKKELKDLLKVLDALKEQIQSFKNQLHSTQSKLAKNLLKKLIKNLEKNREQTEVEIKKLIAESSKFQNKIKLMTSIKGVGELTAYKILAYSPDIDCFVNAKQFAAFIGVTPKQNQSGCFQGRTTLTRMGDSRLRKILFMAALVAKNHNEHLKPFVSRLADNNKAPKAIVGALMRKLAHLIFGVLKNNRPFDKTYCY